MFIILQRPTSLNPPGPETPSSTRNTALPKPLAKAGSAARATVDTLRRERAEFPQGTGRWLRQRERRRPASASRARHGRDGPFWSDARRPPHRARAAFEIAT